MKIALYYPWIYLTSGAERSILELGRRSRHEWTFFTSHYDPEHTFPGFASQRVVQVGHVSVDRSIAAVARAGWQILNTRLPLEEFDLLLVVCEGVGDLIVFRNSSRPVLCLCLTPLRLAFDEVYRERALAGRSGLQRLLIRAGSAVFRFLDRRAWKHYSRVFCISEEGRRRALNGGLGSEERMEVRHVGLGFEPAAELSPAGRYFLLPGRIMWTKNIELGIQAFRLFRDSHPEFSDYRLVIAGIVDRKSEAYLAKLREMAAGDSGIEFRIFPSDPELAEMYSGCCAVLFTAFNEDWGIVPLEGMAFGKPVVAVNRGGPRESVQHGVQGFLEEAQAPAFAARMAQLAGDPALRNQMGSAGLRRAQLFSWQDFTRRIDEEIDLFGAPRPLAEGISAKGQVRAW